MAQRVIELNERDLRAEVERLRDALIVTHGDVLALVAHLREGNPLAAEEAAGIADFVRGVLR